VFDELKERLLLIHVLFSKLSKSFEVHIESSGFPIGVVLMQNKHLITSENKKLAKAQLRWRIHNKQLFVVVSCFKTR
jgi:hypothetical protein